MQQQHLPLEPDTGADEPWSPMEGVLVLPRFVDGERLLAHVDATAARAPFRHMITPGGHKMSAAMTNCGFLGWVSDRKGYRYAPTDPESGAPWPAMPEDLRASACNAAARAGFPGFNPDACLINRYAPGARMGLHQDRDEADFSQPVVTLSAGLPGLFQLAGARRSGPSVDIPLASGDALVLGGPARLYYHGVRPVRKQEPISGPDYRVSLTFRRAAKLHTIQ